MPIPQQTLIDFATQLLLRAGLDDDKAQAVAEVLVDGDLLGHDTHGLAQLAPYLAELESGSMQKEGEPAVLADAPAAVTWDGRRLPGPWLVLRAMKLAMAARQRQQGVALHPGIMPALAPWARKLGVDEPAAGS